MELRITSIIVPSFVLHSRFALVFTSAAICDQRHRLYTHSILFKYRQTAPRRQTSDGIGMMHSKIILASIAGILVSGAQAFVFSPARCNSIGPLYSEQPGQQGRLERIEYKIYPDGRVEEKVLGVKGESCLEITREINEKLGEVISTTPTEEMFEEEIKIDQTLSNTESDSGSSWEGSSSW